MSEVTLKYRAFLSYSHADSAVAQRVHRRLESFHIDRELFGRMTPAGAVPQTLRPIFRDRNDFDAGSSLDGQTRAALDNSAALVVLASPNAARSIYVNEEVRLFKSRHPERPVVPLIADGAPGDPERECFPRALRFAVTPDGAITDTPADLLAADLRESGDGVELALAKVVARLLGLSPDDVYRRAERERRRQSRLRGAIAAVIAILAIVGGGLYWQSYRQKQTLTQISALVDKYSLATPAAAATPGARQSLTDAITAIAEGAATDPRYAQALALLKAGKPDEAEPLLKAVAEDREHRAARDAKDAAAAYRNLASIAAVSDPARARDDYARAARLDPTDVRGMSQNGWYQENAGQLDAAQAAFTQVLAMAKPGSDDEDIVWAKFGTGDIQFKRGDLDASLRSYRAAQTIVENLAKAEPANVTWQYDLAVSARKVGDVQVAQGDLPAALASYQAMLAIAQPLAQSDPGNARLQNELSISYEKVGDVQAAQGDLPAALRSYRAAHAIAERLASDAPSNAQWQLNLSVSDDRIGDVELSHDNLPAALDSYQAALAIRQRLAKADPGDAGSQRALSISHEKVSSVQERQGNLPAALDSYRADLTIMERLAKSDPGNAEWQRDLSVPYNRIGDVQMAQGDLPAALGSYQAALAIRQRLVKSDPGNAGWQRDLSLSYNKLGDLQMAQGDPSAALGSFQAALAIRERLVSADPANAGWQHDLAASYRRVAAAYLKSQQIPDAQHALAAGRAVLAQLIAQHADPPSQWHQDLDWFDRQIAALKQ